MALRPKPSAPGKASADAVVPNNKSERASGYMFGCVNVTANSVASSEADLRNKLHSAFYVDGMRVFTYSANCYITLIGTNASIRV